MIAFLYRMFVCGGAGGTRINNTGNSNMRFFVNRMDDYVPGSRIQINQDFYKGLIRRNVETILQHMPPKSENCDGGLYVGCAGVAYAFYYLTSSDAMADSKQNLLKMAKDYIDVSVGYTTSSVSRRDPPTAFLLGGAGVFAVASLIYDAVGQGNQAKEMRKKYQQLANPCKALNFMKNGSDELFVGRAGYLCGALLLNNAYGKQIVSVEDTTALCKTIVQSGVDYSRRHRSNSALMYAYYDTEYLGAAHGLSSILQMLLSFPEFLKTDVESGQRVWESTEFMLGLLQQNGNIAPAMDEVVHPRPEEEELVHWCHGMPGIVYLFAKAYLIYHDKHFLDACLQCGELTWKRGLLKKGPGICHGVAGSGYVFLLLYRLTGDDRHLHRALRFAEFMQSTEFHAARTPDSPYSLYEGLAGTVCFLVDLLQPQRAQFPFFDVFV